jgi:biotin transport system ATP-binding protein/energy-coupling factor transport system ATP-binding protein
MIAIDSLVYRYGTGERVALDGVSLSIAEGERLALIGPNGCGKTTLVKHLNGLLVPTSGDVLVDGMNTRDKKKLVEIRRRVGMIFQNPDNQIVGMTLEEDVAFGPGNLRLPPAEIRGRVDRALAAVGLNGQGKRHPHSLSGGEKQLLALAGILAMEPRYLVLDEPTSSLDPAARGRVLAMIGELQSRGIGIVHATHVMEEAAWADRVVVMDSGRVVGEGTPPEIFGRATWLRDLGLAPPPMVELMWRLREAGVTVSQNALHMDQAIDEIVRVAGRGEDRG